MKVPLSAPDITEKEKEYVQGVMDGILSIGPMVERFERLVAEFAGVKYAVAVNSGTSALHLILRSLGLKKGNRVITTSFSFIASSNVVLFENGVPVFTDIDIETYNLKVNDIETLIDENTTGILPVDVFGYPVDIMSIKKIARHHGLFVVEDSCEAIGSSIDNRMCGSAADAGAYAFYPNKQITTAEGGMVLTNDKDLYMRCCSMRNQGRSISDAWLAHERLGFNYRLSELHAAIGIAQMERIEEILQKRRIVAHSYYEMLRHVKILSLPPAESDRIRNGWFVYVIRLNCDQEEALSLIESGTENRVIHRGKHGQYHWSDSAKKETFLRICDRVDRKRRKLIEFLSNTGIESRAYFSPIHLQPFYKDRFHFKRGDYPVTEFAASGTIALPFYSNLEFEKIEFVCEMIEKFIRKEEK